MKLAEVRELLAMISAYDERKRLSADTAPQAWFELLAGVSADDARQAVTEHYRQPEPSAIMPGDILKRARLLAQQRAPRPALPARPHRGERGEMAREVIREITDGAVARYRAEHPEHRPYRHRPAAPVRVRAYDAVPRRHG